MSTGRVRRLLKDVPWVYETGALAALFRSLYLTDHSRTHFGFIGRIAEKGALAVDVGANRGQTIARIAHLQPTWSIVSFEPNPHCQGHLRIMKAVLGKRLTVHQVGLSDAEGEADYFEPSVSRIHVAAEGTFEPANLDSSVETRLGGKFEVRKSRLQLKTLDSYNLDPAFVKIDVQGLEDKVLAGMQTLLARSKPVLLIERNRLNMEKIEGAMAGLGYQRKDAELGAGADDFLFVHPQSKHQIT